MAHTEGKRYTRQIGELVRNGRTVYYTYIFGNRDLRAHDAAVREESYDRTKLVDLLVRAGVIETP